MNCVDSVPSFDKTDRTFADKFFKNNSNFLDCGTDHALLLELAQMRSDTDDGQLYRFYDGNAEIIFRKSCNFDIKKPYISRATPHEVYEYLKSGKLIHDSDIHSIILPSRSSEWSPAPEEVFNHLKNK